MMSVSVVNGESRRPSNGRDGCHTRPPGKLAKYIDAGEGLHENVVVQYQ